jgi:hypothetical protein
MKKTVATGLMTGLGAPAAAAVTDSATAKTDCYSSCYGDDYSISRSSDYYWRRWQLQQPNRLLQRWLLLQQQLGRLIETRHDLFAKSLPPLVAVLTQPGYRPGLDRDGDGIACER